MMASFDSLKSSFAPFFRRYWPHCFWKRPCSLEWVLNACQVSCLQRSWSSSSGTTKIMTGSGRVLNPGVRQGILAQWTMYRIGVENKSAEKRICRSAGEDRSCTDKISREGQGGLYHDCWTKAKALRERRDWPWKLFCGPSPCRKDAWQHPLQNQK